MAKRIMILKSKESVKQVIPKETLDRLAGDGKEFSDNQKKKIGRELVKKMRSRTAENLDINEENFADYGSGSNAKGKEKLAYLRRKEKVLGKSIGKSEVDMKFMDKLLKSQQVRVNEEGDLEIFHKGKLNNKKAFGHTGSKRPKGVPKRDYFGVRSSDVSEVASRFNGTDVDGSED